MVSGITIKYLGGFIVTLFALLLIFPSAATASEFRAGDRLVIAKDQVINDDIYLAGNSVLVEGTVNGDLIVAGGNVRVNGTVNGSLMAAGGSVVISGNVKDDIRVAGGTIAIGGSAGDNVLAFGGDLVLEKNAGIGRDLTIGAGRAAVNGTVNGNVNGGASNMVMGGTVAGNVSVNIGDNLIILPGARIGGNLEYTAPKPAEISGTVAGKVTYKEAPRRERDYVSGAAGKILEYLWLLVVGIVALILAPEIVQSISDSISTGPLRKALWGILLLIVTPIIAIIFLITIIGIPLGLILLAVYIIAVYLSRVFVGLWIGQYVLGRSRKEARHRALALAVGLLIVLILISLPIIGIFIHFVIIVLGLGAIALTGYDGYRKLKGERSA